MKIIKYIFLLMLLALVGFSVYIATQNGAYTVTQSAFIKVPKEVVFNYVNDYRNWDRWLDLDADSTDVKFTFPENTVGQDASFSWIEANEQGLVQSLNVRENNRISQKIIIDERTSWGVMNLKDSLGGTKLSWTVKGSADFSMKIKAAYSGGIQELGGKMYQNSLNTLDFLLTNEIKKYSVEVIGKVKIDSVYYVKQTATVKVREMNSKITPMLQKMYKFFKNGNLKMYGKPFVIYESSDAVNKTITFSVCGPLKEEIFVSNPSDVTIAKLQPFTALKTVLKGDYSHRDQAVKKAMNYITEKSLNPNTALKYIDIYTKNASVEKSPSKWVTEVLIPLTPKVVAAPVFVKPPVIPAEDLIVK